MSGCHIKNRIPASLANELMTQSLFSLHIRGDDATSSRMYEAIASGTPQLLLGSRFYEDGAPFK